MTKEQFEKWYLRTVKNHDLEQKVDVDALKSKLDENVEVRNNFILSILWHPIKEEQFEEILAFCRKNNIKLAENGAR